MCLNSTKIDFFAIIWRIRRQIWSFSGKNGNSSFAIYRKQSCQRTKNLKKSLFGSFWLIFVKICNFKPRSSGKILKISKILRNSQISDPSRAKKMFPRRHKVHVLRPRALLICKNRDFVPVYRQSFCPNLTFSNYVKFCQMSTDLDKFWQKMDPFFGHFFFTFWNFKGNYRDRLKKSEKNCDFPKCV